MIRLWFLLALGTAWAGDWEPRHWPPPAPGVATGPPVTESRQGVVEWAYRWYHHHVSPRDGARCPYYPTCSGYALLAIRERGVLVGTLLTLDRLLREYPWMERFDHYPVVTPHGTPRFLDPVPPRRASRATETSGHGDHGT